jgi:hypothetical protein
VGALRGGGGMEGEGVDDLQLEGVLRFFDHKPVRAWGGCSLLHQGYW